MVPPPCSRGCFTNRGDIWTMGSQRFRSAYLWSEYALSLFDTVTATGIYWTQAADPLPYWAKASPLRCLFHWWAQTKGYQLVHAAAVGCEGRGVLITGKGGVGKSTTALSCLGKGLNYVGDDYVVVQLDPAPQVHSLYSTAKLNWDQMARFPGLADLVSNQDTAASEKAVMYLCPGMDGRIARSLPLHAILTPRIVNQPQTELEAISAAALHRATAFTTMSQLPHASQYTHEFISSLIEKLSGFQLALGRDLEPAIDVIVRLLTTSRSEIECLSTGVWSDERARRPLVSVIIPVHNAARFLPDAVASVVAQKYPAIEIIVVDDGSSDNIDDALSRLPVDVRFLKQRHSGTAAACNRGIREASGELVTFLGADTQWLEGNLQLMVDLLSDDRICDLVQGFGRCITLDAETASYRHAGNPNESFAGKPTVLVCRCEVFKTVGLFDPASAFVEDIGWYERVREHGFRIRRADEVMIMRHAADMTCGRSVQELNRLRMLKTALERERAESRSPIEDELGSRGPL